MKRLLVESVIHPDPGGPTYLRPTDPAHLMLAQSFAHQHIEALARDAIVGGATEPTVAGFGLTLTGGLNLTIAAGHAVGVDGVSYAANGETQITLAPAHATQARVDLVYALITPAVKAANEFIFMRRQLTPEEAAQNPPPVYEPDQLNVPTELRNQAVVMVKTGIPAANPAVPVANANEVPLFEVRVPASAANLVIGNVVDTRNLFYSLYQLGRDHLAFVGGINELIEARLNLTLQVAPDTGLSKTYDNAANTLTLSGVAASAGAMGMMSAAHFNMLSAATANNTANALVRRDANGRFNAGLMSIMAPGTAGEDKAATKGGLYLATPNAAQDGNVLLMLHDQAATGGVKFLVQIGTNQNSPAFQILVARGSHDRKRFHVTALGATHLYGNVNIDQDDGGVAAQLNVSGPVTATAFNNSSDRAAKTDFRPVDPRAVLETLAGLPLFGWRFRSESEGVRHIGPTAQDFRRLFGLGFDDKHIATVDADGVVMASVQGLYLRVQELTAEVSRLRSRLHE